MEIRPVDVSDDDELHRYYTAMREAALFERPDAPLWGERDMLLSFRQLDPAESITPHAAFETGEIVGTAFYALPLLDNTEKAWLDVSVPPAVRRRGIGTALVAYLVDLAHGDGRETMLAESAYPFDRRDDHPYRRFAERNGFELSLTEVRRDLELPVPRETLEAWIAEAAAHHAGYRIETFDDRIPAQLLESFLYVANQLSADAPQGEVAWEAEAVTPEAYEQRRLNSIEAGRRVYHTLGIGPDGDVVAHSTLSVPEEDMPNIYQWGTLVRRDHRGHRLGLAVKARSLLEVQRRHPERTRITTANAEINTHMVAINERMGFVPIEILAEFQRKLPSPSARRADASSSELFVAERVAAEAARGV